MNQVPEEFAIAEGEGDRTYQYWKEVHEKFFTDELNTLGLQFSDDMMLVCEPKIRLEWNTLPLLNTISIVGSEFYYEGCYRKILLLSLKFNKNIGSESNGFR